ncbi:MAG TPA: LysR substrate-binding domain-containing protein [Azospirillaceae bacterium]|nr:LysR substrate-binding domain-containing protein [Azospirillaceae bacterium]
MSAGLTLRQLRYLVSVADHLHFGRAAQANHVSQPSLSAQIQQLEELLGVTLVERTQRRVLLTPAGEQAVARARAILAAVDDLAAGAKASSRPLSGELRLGVFPTLGPYLLPRVLPGLRQAYPDLRLYLREDLTERLLERLRGGDLDACLLALPVDEPGVTCEALFDEPFLVALPPGHALAARARVSESDLAEERLLLLEDGHCFREQALKVCRIGSRDRDSVAATSLSTLCEMVAGRIGVTLLPALASTSLTIPGQIEIRPFPDPAPSRRIALVWRKASAREADLRRLADHLRAHLPEGAIEVAA